MAYDVSSSFESQTRSKSPNVERTFTIAGSDYSDRVIKWPKFKRTWDDIRPRTIQIKLANGDKGMNFLRTDKTLMEGQCLLNMGVVGETIILFEGKIRATKYLKEDCNISIVDKFQQLSERKMGSSDVPVNYMSSNYLPSDIAWWAVTSYGGYSNLTSSNNPDIDYDAFATWAGVFSGDSVFVEGTFDGQKVTEVLRKISRHTHSAIFIKENKISFHRFGLADANVSSLGPADIIDMELSFDTSDITNRQYVSGDFNTSTKAHQFTVLQASSASVNSFGIKETTLLDNNLWYVNSASAINLAQRKILANAEPDDSITVQTGLVGLPRQIGETMLVEDAFHNISESYRILDHQVDMDSGKTLFRIDRTQLTNAFVLDTTSLGSTLEVLT